MRRKELQSVNNLPRGSLCQLQAFSGNNSREKAPHSHAPPAAYRYRINRLAEIHFLIYVGKAFANVMRGKCRGCFRCVLGRLMGDV
jgi:hypothetical protein